MCHFAQERGLGKNEVERKAWKAKAKQTEILALDKGRNYTEQKTPALDEGRNYTEQKNPALNEGRNYTETPALDAGRNCTETPALDKGSIYTDRNVGIRQRQKLYRTETLALDEVSNYR